MADMRRRQQYLIWDLMNSKVINLTHPLGYRSSLYNLPSTSSAKNNSTFCRITGQDSSGTSPPRRRGPHRRTDGVQFQSHSIPPTVGPESIPHLSLSLASAVDRIFIYSGVNGAKRLLHSPSIDYRVPNFRSGAKRPRTRSVYCCWAALYCRLPPSRYLPRRALW
jgi:hypothetical protein